MAYWTQLDDDNKVLQVTIGDDNEADKGYSWLIDNIGGRWVETVADNFAGIGWTYLEGQGFYSPSPYPSWVLDGLIWKAPIDKPEGDFSWDETLLNWVKATVLNNGD
tara:strand:+ start:1983 stop:2303 length:321 start_codon:yes stop_codon:yes gene_type:complete